MRLKHQKLAGQIRQIYWAFRCPIFELFDNVQGAYCKVHTLHTSTLYISIVLFKLNLWNEPITLISNPVIFIWNRLWNETAWLQSFWISRKPFLCTFHFRETMLTACRLTCQYGFLQRKLKINGKAHINNIVYKIEEQ